MFNALEAVCMLDTDSKCKHSDGVFSQFLWCQVCETERGRNGGVTLMNYVLLAQRAGDILVLWCLRPGAGHTLNISECNPLHLLHHEQSCRGTLSNQTHTLWGGVCVWSPHPRFSQSIRWLSVGTFPGDAALLVDSSVQTISLSVSPCRKTKPGRTAGEKSSQKQSGWTPWRWSRRRLEVLLIQVQGSVRQSISDPDPLHLHLRQRRAAISEVIKESVGESRETCCQLVWWSLDLNFKEKMPNVWVQLLKYPDLLLVFVFSAAKWSLWASDCRPDERCDLKMSLWHVVQKDGETMQIHR